MTLVNLSALIVAAEDFPEPSPNQCLIFSKVLPAQSSQRKRSASEHVRVTSLPIFFDLNGENRPPRVGGRHSHQFLWSTDRSQGQRATVPAGNDRQTSAGLEAGGVSCCNEHVFAAAEHSESPLERAPF